MKKIPTAHLSAEDLGLPRARFLPTLLTLALIGTAASDATEVTFKYFRFTPTKNYNTTTTTAIQLSEFTFGLRGSVLNVRGSTGAGPSIDMAPTGGTNTPNAGEGIEKMFDGNVQTKMYSGNRGPFIFTFTNPVTVDSYNFATANDSNDRTPVSWTLEGSTNGTTWVVIDTRADVGITNTYRTYQSGWPIGGGTAIPVFTTFDMTAPALTPITYGEASPGIVKLGEPTSLSWIVTGTSPSGTLLNPGAMAQGDSGTQAITPAPGLTAYTLTASNASGTSGNTANIRSVTGGSATFKFFRFTPLALRNNLAANSIQVAEFEFFNAGVEETSVPTVTNPGGNNPGTEIASKLVDGDPASKWLDFNKAGVVFEFPAAITMDSYQMVTGGDAPERDPVSWLIEGSSDGTTWELVDAVAGEFPAYPTPLRRRTATGKLPIAGRSLVWKSDANGTWDTSTANFNPKPGDPSATPFYNGDVVTFADGPAITNLVLPAAISPAQVTFSNPTQNYTLSGSPITGNGRLFKTGAGTLTLSAANTFTGPVSIKGGMVVAETSRSLGAAQSTSRLEIGGNGSGLTFNANQSSQRPMEVLAGGATINVANSVTFTKVGRTDFSGTLTKTGGGTLRFESYTGSTATATDDLVINEGIVDFGTGYYADFIPYPASSLNIVVNSQGTLRLGERSPLGGHHQYTTNSIGQIRLLGGSMDVTNIFTYFPTGTVSGQGRVALQGGLISGGGTFEPAEGTSATEVTTFTALASEVSSLITGPGGLALNPGNITLITEAGSVLEITRAVTGNYGIRKEGAGELILSNNGNTYSGTNGKTWTANVGIGTDITAGTLTLKNSSGSATGTSAVTIAAGAKLQGSGSATGTVTIAGTVAPGEPFTPTGELKLGNTTITGSLAVDIDGLVADKLSITGTCNVAGSTITVTGTLTEPIYELVRSTAALTGTFASQTIPSGYTLKYSQNAVSLVSNTAPPYDAWAAGLSDPAMGADPDHDGIVNLLEFILNSNGEASSTADLPDVSTNPAGDLIFTFVRKSSAASYGAVVEYSTSLAAGSWTTFAGTNVQTNTPSAGLDTVTATLPASLAAPGGRIFARLKVDIPE